MQSERSFPLWLRAAIPLMLALLLSLSGLPAPLRQTYRTAQEARETNNPAGEARALAQIAAWQPWQKGLWEEAGLQALKGGELEVAIQYLQKAQSLGYLSRVGYLGLAEAYELTNNTQAAGLIWEELAQSAAPSSEVHEKLSQFFWQSGELDRALSLAQSWVVIYPENPQANLRVGLLLLADKPEKAVQYLVKAKKLAPNLAASVDPIEKAYQLSLQEQHAGYQKVMLGRALGNLGYWQLAEQLFIRGTHLTPDYAEAWAFLGEARQQLGKDGLDALEKAGALDPQSVITRVLTALYYRRQGKLDESLALLQAVARQEPQQPMWQIELGNTMLEKKDISGALGYYQAAALMDQKNPTYWTMLAEFCAAHDVAVREVGLNAARQAVTLAPEDPAALDAMGQVMAGLGDFSSAERFFTQSLSASPNDAQAHLHLAQVLIRMEEIPRAHEHLVQAYQNAAETSDTRVIAQRLLERLFGAAP